MNLATLNTLARARGLNHSELARLCGVSRQAVHKWFASNSLNPEHDGERIVDVRSSHLERLAAGLEVSADVLLRPLPGLTANERRELRVSLLWDRLYPDLDQFLSAIVRHEPRALARLVEAFGLYRAEKIIGRTALRNFPSFARYIPPARREGLLQLWHWRLNPTPC